MAFEGGAAASLSELQALFNLILAGLDALNARLDLLHGAPFDDGLYWTDGTGWSE